MMPCESAHLLEPLERNERSDWLPLSLDDELVVSERNPVEQVVDPVANVERGQLLRHDRTWY